MTKTAGGLSRAKLVRNKRGKLVSKKKREIGRKLARDYPENRAVIALWREAVANVNRGKVTVPRKGTPLHRRAKTEFRKLRREAGI